MVGLGTTNVLEGTGGDPIVDGDGLGDTPVVGGGVYVICIVELINELTRVGGAMLFSHSVVPLTTE
jgi:hypothetical protein